MKVILLLLLVSGSTLARGDADRFLNITEKILYWNYPTETHTITTGDGYHIEIQRIPYGRDSRSIEGCKNKRPPVLLMHGLFSSGAQYVLNPPASNTAFIFADAGFDVWIGNVRGTEYGRKHKTLDIFDFKFWDFSWHEYQHYDLKDTVDYILETTKEKGLFYIGHSQGTTIMFARLAEADLEWQKKIRAFFALAPNAGSIHPAGLLNLLQIPFLETLLQFLTQHLPSFGVGLPKFISTMAGSVCGYPIIGQICVAAASQGPESYVQINTTRLPVYIEPFPSFTSTLNLLHWAQIYKYKSLRMLDKGKEYNLKKYGTEIPPAYNLSNIHASTEIFYSSDDHIADAAGVNEVILKTIGPGLRKTHSFQHYSHFDYAVGLLAPDEIYHPIVNTIYEDVKRDGC